MRLSRFIIVIPEATGSYLIASTVTKAVVRFNARAWADLQRGDPARLTELTADQWQQCKTMQFIVEDFFDEAEYIKNILNHDRLYTSALSVYLAFTTGCDFDCVYCYEKGQIIKKAMSDDVLTAVIAWFERILSVNP
jgi:sulfatase maturation enzyme AslB (radical SAM superfamily)